MFYMKYSYIRLAADILGTRCEKYSSKLDISRSFLPIFAFESGLKVANHQPCRKGHTVILHCNFKVQ